MSIQVGTTWERQKQNKSKAWLYKTHSTYDYKNTKE